MGGGPAVNFLSPRQVDIPIDCHWPLTEQQLVHLRPQGRLMAFQHFLTLAS